MAETCQKPGFLKKPGFLTSLHPLTPSPLAERGDRRKANEK
jgi:hypothetical protein